ncbi:MAG TPA: putative sugar nucleotidyl transferase, partial [Chitinophagaceae bacterium]|nr:putative sugar nucleotidyl transferase [Chitinophagaceae bacterium]
MRKIVLVDDPEARERLFPFSLTRPLPEIRIGITTLAEKWAHFLGGEVGYATAPYLSVKYPERSLQDSLFIWSHLLPNVPIASALGSLQEGQALVHGQNLIGWTGQKNPGLDRLKQIPWTGPIQWLEHPFQIFQWNGQLIREDFAWITASRKSAPVCSTNHLTCPDQIFLEEGAQVEHAFLNATQGPIYIGKDAQVMEGAMIRGPFSLGLKSVVKMGATIYGATSFGPHCCMGGEIKNTVVFGYSNKAHGGYLGDTVVGEWCNL